MSGLVAEVDELVNDFRASLGMGEISSERER